MKISDKFWKRIFDLFFSISGILIIFPVVILAWLIASVETRSNGFFLQKRIGLNGKPFTIFKIKTMVNTKNKRSSITSTENSAITRFGLLMRKLKIDELPQLLNIAIGDMSFVGPRPDVPGYADLLEGDDRIVLEVRPGITGPASIKYKNEEYLLSQQPDPQSYNDSVIWPDKIRLNKLYVNYYSFTQDIKYLIQTVMRK